MMNLEIDRAIIPAYIRLSCLHLSVGSMPWAEEPRRRLMKDRQNLQKKLKVSKMENLLKNNNC